MSTPANRSSVAITGVSYGVRFLHPSAGPRKFSSADHVRGAGLIYHLVNEGLPVFLMEDLIDLKEFAAKLRNPARGSVLNYFKDRFGDTTRRLLEEFQTSGSNDKDLPPALQADLNAIIYGGPLSNHKAYQKINEKARRQFSKWQVHGGAASMLNRRILEAFFPGIITRCPACMNPVTVDLPIIREYRLKPGISVTHREGCEFRHHKSDSVFRIGEKIEIEMKPGTDERSGSTTIDNDTRVWMHYADPGHHSGIRTHAAKIDQWAKHNIFIVPSLRKSHDYGSATLAKDLGNGQSLVFVVDVNDLAKETKICLSSSMEALCVDVLYLIDELKSKQLGVFDFIKGPQGVETSAGAEVQAENSKPASIGARLHIIVRIEREACLWIQPFDGNGSVRLLWHKCRRPPWNKQRLGGLAGRSCLLGTCLALSFVRNPNSVSAVEQGIARFLGVAHDWFVIGYSSGQNPLEELQNCLRRAFGNGERDDYFTIKLDWSKVVDYKKRWRITEQWLRDRKSAPLPPATPDAYFLDAGMTILTQKETCEMPHISIGHLKLVDRLEIEDHLAVRNALLEYADGPITKEKPLNLAVFGPPGDGKSSGVKALIADLADSQEIYKNEPLEFNMSQFTSLSELWEALHQCRNESLKGKVPVALIDEFDATYDNQQFGWLKYFLAPMQDGKFFADGQLYELGKMVFVFAGGINRSMDEFNSRIRNNAFCAAKGPDFISRLRGVLNVRGISNPPDSFDAGIYVLRRAIKLESILGRMHSERGFKKIPRPLMSSDLANAFLSVNTFKHGVRSMEAILKMSHFVAGETMKPSDLPVKEQLSLHVDCREFCRPFENESTHKLTQPEKGD